MPREAALLALCLTLVLRPSCGLSGRSDTTENCIWGICSVVIVRQNTDDSGTPSRSLVLHRCDPSTRHPEKCMVSEVVADPDGVSNFTMRRANLREVDVRGFCLFERLSGLDLSENLIERFQYPANMSAECLSRLRWLSLRGNRMRSVDIAQFTRFPALEKVDLSENGLLETLYVSELMQHTRLSAIMAQKCRIKQVDISLVRLPSLQDVDLNYNQLSRLTNRLNWHWTVREVRAIEEERNRRKTRDPYYYARLSVQMVQNQFGPDAFGRLRLWGLPVPDLLEAASSTSPDDAVVNELKRFRDAFQSFLYLDHVGSTVTCDCRLFHAWNYLRRVYADPREFSKRNALSIAEWVSLPCDAAGFGFVRNSGRLQSIATLSADDLACAHTTDCPLGCNCTERVSPSLLTVDCRRRGLRAMPDSLPPSVHPVRYVLLLGGNQISELRALPPSQAQLVQALDLSDNLLSGETDFGPLAAYHHIHSTNLSGNWQLTDLPSSLLTNATSRFPGAVLHLSVGQLVCRCGLLESDAVVPMRWLLADYRHLRCRVGSASGEDSGSSVGSQQRQTLGGGGADDALFLAEFHHRYCLRVPQVNSTPVVIYQQPPNVAGSNTVLYIIVALVVAVLLILIGALACVFTCRRRQNASSQQRQQQQQRQQLQQQQQQQQQLQCSQSMTSQYDTATPSARYVSCGEKIYFADSAQLAKAGSIRVGLALQAQPLLGASQSLHSSRLPNAASDVNDDADSSDFSCGDLSDSESALASAGAATAGSGTYQTVPTARTAQLWTELPPPLPPRPVPPGISGGSGVYQQQQQQLQRVALAFVEQRDRGTDV